MNIGAIPYMAIQQSVDIKLEKNVEAEETRAIEGSGESGGSKLETNGQNIVQKEATADSSNDGDIEYETYNAKGNLTRKVPPESMEKQQGGPINAASGLAQDIKEISTEMLAKERRMGEFKDQNWIDEAKNFQIGPDIRFAVKSKNIDFLKRIQWGPLTSAEFREVSHQIRKLKALSGKSPNMLKGQIFTDEDIGRGRSYKNRSVIDNKVQPHHFSRCQSLMTDTTLYLIKEEGLVPGLIALM